MIREDDIALFKLWMWKIDSNKHIFCIWQNLCIGLYSWGLGQKLYIKKVTPLSDWRTAWVREGQTIHREAYQSPDIESLAHGFYIIWLLISLCEHIE